MPENTIIVIAVVLTLAYTLIGLRAMLHIDAALGARYLPKTNWGTWASIIFWPLWWLIALVRYNLRTNRRVLS